MSSRSRSRGSASRYCMHTCVCASGVGGIMAHLLCVHLHGIGTSACWRLLPLCVHAGSYLCCIRQTQRTRSPCL